MQGASSRTDNVPATCATDLPCTTRCFRGPRRGGATRLFIEPPRALEVPRRTNSIVRVGTGVVVPLVDVALQVRNRRAAHLAGLRPPRRMGGRGGRLAEWPDAGRGFDADLAWACGPVWRLGRLSFGFMGPHSKHDADWTRQRSCTVGSGGHSGHSVMYITYVAFLLRVIISQGFQPLGSSVVVAQSTIRFVTERVRVPRATGGRDGRDDGWSWRARRSSGRR
jgi:hypothetical protein